MPLADYLSTKAICMHLEPEERDGAVRRMLERLVEGEIMPGQLLDGALKAILDRESLGSTAIGRGIAVPHARLEELEDILVAFGFSAKGVEFNSLDRQPVHQIFLVIAPKNHTEEYVSVMERITRLVQNADFRRFVAQTSTAEEVVELVEEMEQ
ncbi:MAG: PTS sugar transporter subunit IIA [Candidatus Brocadiia bacterium]